MRKDFISQSPQRKEENFDRIDKIYKILHEGKSKGSEGKSCFGH